MPKLSDLLWDYLPDKQALQGMGNDLLAAANRGGSRGAGQGTSNYVLFSSDLPRIIEKNGVPTGQTPWTPEEWAAYLSGGGK